jgi:O-antigen ligase
VTPTGANGDARPDRTARLLEVGLAALLVLAPFSFGAVRPAGRLALELGAFALLLVWLGRASFRTTPLPPAAVRVGLVGMLLLVALQALPLGAGAVGAIDPQSVALRDESRPPADARQAETRLLGVAPDRLDRPAALSLDPGASASALRTGAALAAVLLVATTVAATCGPRRIALALLLGAAFQGLYGLLVVASGHDQIWLVPKKYFLNAATGTFVNPNHFSCLLAMSLPCGLALVYRNARAAAGKRRAVWLGGEGSRNWMLGLLLIVGLAGLLLSYSRAGIAFALLALALTMIGAGRRQAWKTRLVVAVLVAAVALTPLVQLGAERLLERYADAPEELHGARVRVWVDTIDLLRSHPWTGCGVGAFSAGYPLVRSPEIRHFFAHVHNDPLQWLAEGGILGLLVLLPFLLPLLRDVVRGLSGAKGTIAVGVAAGLVAVGLHGIVDFNLHIPSNAAVAAALAGTLLGLPCKPAD